MKSIRKLYMVILISLVLFCSGVLVASAADQNVVVTNTNSNAVYVRTGNNVLSINNTTWDQRLNYIQTASQGTKTDLDTIINRFGFTGMYRLDDALSMIYTENQGINSKLATVVSNGAILVSNSDVYNLLSSQFPSSVGGTLLGKLNSIQLSLLDEFPQGLPSAGSNTKWYIRQGAVGSISSAAISSNIYSELVTVDNKLFDAVSYLSSIQAYTGSYLPDIESDTSSISKETSNIRGYIRDYFPLFGNNLTNISSYTSYLPNTYSDLHTLKEFFADDDTLAQKSAAKASSDKAINTFTGNGKSAASGSDYSSIDSFSDSLKTSFNSGVAPSNLTNVLSDGSNWGWFSQATYDSINPQSNMRKTVSNDYSVESYMALYEQLEDDGVPDPLQVFYEDLDGAVNE